MKKIIFFVASLAKPPPLFSAFYSRDLGSNKSIRNQKRLLFALICILLLASNSSTAALVTQSFSTSDGFNFGGSINQGFWYARDAGGSQSNFNTSIIATGKSYSESSGNTYFNSYFSFYLEGILGEIGSAYLEVWRGSMSSQEGFEILELYDVTTDVVLLNTFAGSFDQARGVFNDLASGVRYGSYTIEKSPPIWTDKLILPLNEAAITGLNQAGGGWFSIGGTLSSLSDDGTNETIFGGVDSPVSLVVTIVPIPAAAWLFISSLAGIAVVRSSNK